MIIWYDRDGKPLMKHGAGIDSPDWVKQMKKVEKLLGDKNYKIVKQQFTPNKKYWVSTVWLGIDHSFNWMSDEPNPRPLIFETMVFSGRIYKGKSLKIEGGTTLPAFPHRRTYEQERYVNEAEALEGHKRLFKKYSKKDKS